MNVWDVVLALVVAAVVALAIRNMRRARCSDACCGCANSSVCGKSTARR